MLCRPMQLLIQLHARRRAEDSGRQTVGCSRNCRGLKGRRAVHAAEEAQRDQSGLVLLKRSSPPPFPPALNMQANDPLAGRQLCLLAWAAANKGAAHMQWWSRRATHLHARHPGLTLHGCCRWVRATMSPRPRRMLRMPAAVARCGHAAAVLRCAQHLPSTRLCRSAAHPLTYGPAAPTAAHARTTGPATHLPHTRQCLERAGRGSLQVLHCLASG